MKKILPLFLVLALLLGFTACGGGGAKDPTTTAPAANTSGPNGQAEKSITLVADFSSGSVEPNWKEYPYENDGSRTVEAMAAGLTELTGLDFTLKAVEVVDSKTIKVDWAANSTLVGGLDDRDFKEGFNFFDADSLNWFMMDSLYQTILKNIAGTEEVFYTMDGGKELVFRELYPTKAFTLDTPYMGSAFYFAHTDGLGEDDPANIDPASLEWAGDFTNGPVALNIVNYNGESFIFTFDKDGTTDEGTAPLDPENPLLAEYAGIQFLYDQAADSITVTGGDFAGVYLRADSVMG